jgi:hypothetical protein
MPSGTAWVRLANGYRERDESLRGDRSPAYIGCRVRRPGQQTSGLLCIAIAIVLLTNAGCAEQAAGPRAEPSAPVAPPGRTINWDQPLTGGVIINSLQEAEGQLGFTPVEPTKLGTPKKILITDPASSERPDRAIAWVYDHPVFGRFFVAEAMTTLSQDDLEALVKCGEGEAGCDSSGFSLVPIRGDVKALLNEGPVSVNITWLEASVIYRVAGPAETLSTADVIAIAALI